MRKKLIASVIGTSAVAALSGVHADAATTHTVKVVIRCGLSLISTT